MSFKDKEICEEYIEIISKLWPQWISYKDKIVMQFLADICKSMNNAGYLTIDDLYTLSEQEVINKILNCKDLYILESFKKFLETDKVYTSPTIVQNKYCVNTKTKTKTRYIIPLVQTELGAIRINKISEKSKDKIQDYLNIKNNNYVYFDFDFKPYENSEHKVLKKHPI